MKNIEIKAELRDLPLARTLCAAIGATRIGAFRQTDTYFRLPGARLKRRETHGEGEEASVEWVRYERENSPRPRPSAFTIYTDEAARERFGPDPGPAWVTVRKSRELWLLGNVRIHLDTVEGLGTFVEFEALVSRDHDEAMCHAAIAALREKLAPVIGETIAVGYADMLAAEGSPAS